MNWDTMEGDELNRAIAELRGRKQQRYGVSQWVVGSDKYPDIADDKCAALEAAEWMKGRGWGYRCWTFPGGNYRQYEFSFLGESSAHQAYGELLSLAIARAMGKALESEKK